MKNKQNKHKYKKILKWNIISVVCVMFLGISFFFGVQIYIVQSTKEYILSDVSEAPESDAVMVLGALVYSKSGEPSPTLKDRLDYGYELYSQGKAKKILVSGDHGRKDYDEVNVMKDYLMEKGVPREDIFMDHAGFNTYDSMYRAKEIFGVESLLICTQDFHIARSLYIARSLGINAYGYPCKDTSINAQINKLRESLARVKAIADVTVKRKPKYLGDAIPISGNGILTDG
ncbi:MAG: YdcF family protein [Oscillospiraceae bacterium]|nr:YdcF family protein [Oscillospiraceae bacterium]